MGLIHDFFSGKLQKDRAFNKHATMLYEGGRRSYDRKSAPGYFQGPEDARETSERLQLIREARELEDDHPLAELILDTYDVYAFGFIRYQPMTGDVNFNREISDYLKEWFKCCDFEDRFDFQTLMRLAQRGKKRDGEAGIIHVEQDGEYKIQLINGERIGNPTTILTSNEFDKNGILLDKYGRVRAYDIYKRMFNGATYQHDLTVDASWFSHIFDPFRIDNYHGVSAFKSVATRMRDLKEIMDASRINIKYRSMQLPYLRTESGGIDENPNNPYSQPLGANVDEYGTTLEKVTNGEQNAVNIGEAYVEFPNDFPNTQFLPMVETSVKEILAGVNLSYDFLWKMDNLNGTVGRLVTEREDRVMKQEQSNLERQCMRIIITRAIEHGIRTKQIKGNSPTKFKGEFFYGARISADYGRDAKADIDLVNAGLLTETEYQHIHGRSPEDVRMTRFEETDDLFTDAKTLADKYDLPVDNVTNILRKSYQNPPTQQNVSESQSVTVDEGKQD